MLSQSDAGWGFKHQSSTAMDSKLTHSRGCQWGVTQSNHTCLGLLTACLPGPQRSDSRGSIQQPGCSGARQELHGFPPSQPWSEFNATFSEFCWLPNHHNGKERGIRPHLLKPGKSKNWAGVAICACPKLMSYVRSFSECAQKPLRRAEAAGELF